MTPEDRRQALMALYRAFNAHDADAALIHVAPGVEWASGRTGGTISGRDALRRHWERLWQEVDLRVEPLTIETEAAGLTHVRVERLTRGPDGTILDDSEAMHVYSFDGPFISRLAIRPAPPRPGEEADDADD